MFAPSMKVILEEADKLDWVDLQYCIAKLKHKMEQLHPRQPRQSNRPLAPAKK